MTNVEVAKRKAENSLQLHARTVSEIGVRTITTQSIRETFFHGQQSDCETRNITKKPGNVKLN